jgi:hypothetical protein
MNLIKSVKQYQGFTFNFATGDFGSGVVGTYPLPINLPTGAIVTAIWITPTPGISFAAGAGALISFGVTGTVALFSQASNYTSSGITRGGRTANVIDDPGTTQQQGGVMDGSSFPVMDITVANYTTGAARVDFEYYFPQ